MASQTSSEAQGAYPMGRFRFIVGTCVPVVALGPQWRLLYEIAGQLYLPRMEFLYLVVTTAAAALFAWHVLLGAPELSPRVAQQLGSMLDANRAKHSDTIERETERHDS